MLRRVWVLGVAVACSAFAACGGDSGETGGSGGTTSSSTTTTTTTAGPACGDGALDTGEGCDDGNSASGDGCSTACEIEKGYTCSGTPSACVTTCGDGIPAGAETCDDTNVAAGDGCSATCEIEDGYACDGTPSVCATVCGDSIVAGDEACDDGNAADDDGCGATCAVEDGFTCDTAMPSICVATCGDGKIVGGEKCDDGNTAADDGCAADCAVIETGYECNGAPSVCATVCGDGIVAGDETCDDGNTAATDGCSATCATETGYACDGAPSICATVCGDGIIAGDEICDDSNKAGNDGCAADCTAQESGYTCTGAPSVCVTTCGDGIKAGAETCDDSNTAANDGCSATCAQESGWVCTGAPSACVTVCGDGIKAGAEVCDDTNTVGGDGCSATCAAQEPGFTCTGSPSVCVTTCGDGIKAGSETCDDGNTAANDGCSATCAAEIGYACSGAPSVCAPICGDGLKLTGEKCDDGNTVNGDCCSSTCQVEAGCEIEVNDVIASANDFALLASGNKIKGFITPTADKDVFKVTVPAGQLGSFTAQTLEVAGGPTCASFNLDTTVTLFNAQGTSVGSDTDSGPGYCSLLTVLGLAPGDYYFEVKKGSFGNATFPYMLQVDLTLATCNNGIVETGEQCEDGNLVSGDGCSASCKLEPVAEIEPNGTCGAGTSNGPYTLPPNVLISGAGVGGDQDWFRITLTNYSDLRVETSDASGPGSCVSIDTDVQVFNSSCVALGPVDDDGSALGLCSLLDPTLASQSFMRHLAPGDYYIKVNPHSSVATAYNYTVLASLVATCGNGVKEGSEQCDGGPTCQADCMLVPVCGDGVKSGTEECDDGNTVNGDVCSSTCQLEMTDEVEVNNTCAAANAITVPAGPNGILVGGTYSPPGFSGDQDWWAVTLTAYSDLKIQTFDASGPGSCVSGNDTYIAIYTAANCASGSSFASNDTGGISPCSLLDPATTTAMKHLAPGTYYVKTYGYSTTPGYTMRLNLVAQCGNNIVEGSEQCDGTPDCQADCMKIPGCGNGIVESGEACDDSNLAAGDGCSATCTREPGFLCSGTAPTVCTPICPAGSTFHEYTSTDIPKSIPDDDSTGVTSVVTVSDTGTVQRALVELNVTHTYDSDLDLVLIAPNAATVNLAIGNGGSGDNFTNTLFSDLCTTSLTAGSAPFSGCYKPTGLLSTVNGQASNGTWSLEAVDVGFGDTGTLNSWKLTLCIQ